MTDHFIIGGIDCNDGINTRLGKPPLCPHCGKSAYEAFEADDGEPGTRAVDHISCVRTLEAEVARLREQVTIAYRLWLQSAGDDLGELLESLRYKERET